MTRVHAQLPFTAQRVVRRTLSIAEVENEKRFVGGANSRGKAKGMSIGLAIFASVGEVPFSHSIILGHPS